MSPSPAPLPPPGPIDFAAALFFDLDGTLAPIEARPDLVGPDPRRTALLRALSARLAGRLAVISGRSLAVIDDLLEAAVPAAAGVHGLERRSPNGEVSRPARPPGMDAAAAAFADFAQARPGLIVEDKGLGVTLHYRQAPEAKADVEALAERMAAETGLALQFGHDIAELKTPGADKGAAMQAFMAAAPFAGAVPVFIGDDLTDEAGFAAAGAAGGFGVLVGPPRVTAARYGLADVAAVFAWLEASLSA